MGYAFLFQYQLLCGGDKMSLHLLKISSPLHTTSLASTVLRTDADILVVATASVFIMPALLFMEQPTQAARGRPPIIPLSGDGEVSVHKIRLDPCPSPSPIAWANFYWNWKRMQKPGNQGHFWERSTNWKTLDETFFIHKGQHSGSPCDISSHQTFYWFHLSQTWRVFQIIKISWKQSEWGEGVAEPNFLPWGSHIKMPT